MKCHSCKHGKLRRGVKSQIFTYKGKSITLDQPGLWCDSCEEGILNGEDLKSTERAFEKFKSEVDNLLLPSEIKRIRKQVLHLTQEQAAYIFGGGKNAFSRYEHGKAQPLPAVSNLLKMFERHPEDLHYFL